MRCYRICRREYAKTLFTGEGGLLVSGRWTPKGYRVIYTAESIALALLEYQVNATTFENADVVVAGLYIPDDCAIYEPSPTALTHGWNVLKPQGGAWPIGMEWITRSEYVAMKVPSVVVPREHNILLNPAHPDYVRIKKDKPAKFALDPRLQR